MRFAKVAAGHTVKHKLIYGIVRVLSGYRAPDVIRTLFYREAFFGRHQSRLTQAVMRGPSDWSVGERELFAALVSRLKQCVF